MAIYECTFAPSVYVGEKTDQTLLFLCADFCSKFLGIARISYVDVPSSLPDYGFLSPYLLQLIVVLINSRLVLKTI